MDKFQSDDDFEFADEPEELYRKNEKEQARLFWKILIVDDDKSVHEVTTLVFKNLIFENKFLKIYHAYTIPEAKEIVQSHPDMAVIFLDVVMEEEDSGLQFVKYIRETIKNQIVRIILRTGQPGFAPEKEIINNYDINDYREKTELTGVKLDTTLITALRAYRDLNRIELEKVDIKIHADKAISETENFLQLVTDSLPALISYILKNGIIKFNNKAYTHWFNKTSEEITGIHIKDLFSEMSSITFSKNFNKVVHSDHPINFDMVISHKKMGVRNTNVTLVPHHIDGQLQGCFSLIFDITERKQVEMNLHYLATHDILTNLFNRSYFDANIDPAIKRAKNDNKLLAILFLDLDKFKYINDNLGHDIGDLLLIEISNRIQRCLGKYDTLARLGGDEFVIMVENIQQKEIIEQIAKRICTVLKEEFIIENHKISTSASIGISIYPLDGEDKQTLIKKADFAMYDIKHLHGNGFGYFNQKIAEMASERQIIENSLRTALDKELFEVFYQPIFDLEKKQFVCVEALIRFHHAENGLLLPGSFIEISEEMGLIDAIGEWVLKKSLSDIKLLHNQNFKIKVAVNLSVSQILNENFPKMVEETLKQINLSGSCLELELTESILIKNMDITVKNIKKLKKLGISIAIDDFGTGFSSFNYLNDLPIDIVKIDQTFVSKSTNNLKSAAIIASICQLMRMLNISVTAEGIETEGQMKFLKDCACDRLQGYFLCYPITFNELNKFLNQSVKKLEKFYSS